MGDSYTKGANVGKPPENEGLYEKFKVTRLAESGRYDHTDCWYFVLDPMHDKAAFEALMAYVSSEQVRLYRPQLAADILEKLSDVMQTQAIEDD